MSVILDELDHKFDGKYNYIRVNKVDVDVESGRADIVYLYPYEKEGEFTEADKDKIRSWTLYMMPNKLNYNVIFKKSYIDEEVLMRKVKEYFRTELRSIYHQLSDDDIEVSLDTFMNVHINIGPMFYDYLVEQEKIEQTLKNYLEHSFTMDAKVTVTKKAKDNTFVFEEHDEVVEYARREIDAVEKEMGAIIGKGISTKAMFISDIKPPMQDITIAGKIESFSRRIAKKTGNIYYTFVLNDTTGKVSCKYFTRTKEKGVLDGIVDGQEVLIVGNAEDDSFIKGTAVLVRRLSFAHINYDSINLDVEKNVLHDRYLCVEPEKYVELRQEDIFSLGIDDTIPYMQGKDYVVFDFETTGLNEKEDKPIELGALKIRDGKMIETFSTLINPEVEISDVITGITHIDNDMVKGAPLWSEVVADFYKFTRGAELVGHNVMFDYNILTNNSKELGYTFTNGLVDTCALAQQYIRGQANNKLITLCNFLGISLEGAHRALNDVLATARLFMHIAEKYLS